jgi:type VI secretion system protein ImpE
MTAADHVKAGDLTNALVSLNQQIRTDPSDVPLRVFLFQLNCVLGRFDKALAQLQVVASLDSERMMLAQIFGPIVGCESFRGDVFLGKKSPLVFGEPEEWMGLLLQANSSVAAGDIAGALKLRDQAYEQAPSVAGSINGEPFAWLADADSRLGPMLEVILNGKYYWMPFSRIIRIEMEAPTDLRDLVWMPAQFTLTNGGAVAAHIPTRYVASESAGDDALALARRTDWQEPLEGYSVGLGQRLFATDAADYPLLECRSIEFDQPLIEPIAS